MTSIQKVNFCGVNFVDMTYHELLKYSMQKVETKKGLTITFMDLKRFVKCLFSKKTKALYNEFDVIVPTSLFLIKQIKKVYAQYKYNIREGADFITPIFKQYHEKQYNFMMFGAKQAGVNKLILNLAISFPGLKLIGLYPKDFVESRLTDVRAMITKGDVSVAFIGLGRIKDEKWIVENKDVLKNTVSICVNSSVEIMAGEKKDIPYSYRVANKEYMYALKRNPLRILDMFVWIFIWFKTWFFKRKLKKQSKKEELQKIKISL